tara:strand:+ start:988 stop:1590 length:603 start_codon:yes stop_codon:yes gene_type:complete
VNFLAHIYLSGDNDLITIGNFMADGIKGTRYLKFPPDIQKGIILHRAIDTFTDAHPIVKKSTRRLHKKYSHYSGVIVDILYDHFLAKNWDQYHPQPLADYVANFYQMLDENFELLTPRIQKMVPFMVADNWLLSYAEIEGIAKVLYGMNRRTKNRSGMDRAVKELELHYSEFEEEFTLFFKELEEFCAKRLAEIHLEIQI